MAPGAFKYTVSAYQASSVANAITSTGRTWLPRRCERPVAGSLVVVAIGKRFPHLVRQGDKFGAVA